jgi:hypothetical protein
VGSCAYFAVREGEVSDADILRPVFAVDERTVTTDPGHPERPRCGVIRSLVAPTLVEVEVDDEAVVWVGPGRVKLLLRYGAPAEAPTVYCNNCRRMPMPGGAETLNADGLCWMCNGVTVRMAFETLAEVQKEHDEMAALLRWLGTELPEVFDGLLLDPVGTAEWYVRRDEVTSRLEAILARLPKEGA